MTRLGWLLLAVGVMVGCQKKPKDSGGPPPGQKAPAADVKLASCQLFPDRVFGAIGTSDRTSAVGPIGQGTSTSGPLPGGSSGRRPRLLPKVKILVSSVDGGLDPKLVRRVLRMKQPQAAYCYEQRLVAKPGLAGVMTSSFQIDKLGRVTAAQVSGLDAEVAECWQRFLKQVEFPTPNPAGPVKVTATHDMSFEDLHAAKPAPTPVVKVSDAAVLPGPDPAVVAMVERLLPKLSACYGGGLAKTPGLAGTVILDLEQPPTRRVWGLGDAAVEDCIAAEVGKLAIAVEAGELSCELVLGQRAALRATPRPNATLLEIGDAAKLDGKEALDAATLATAPASGFPALREALEKQGAGRPVSLLIRARGNVTAKVLLALATTAALAGYGAVTWSVAETSELLPGSLRYRPAAGHADTPISLFVRAGDAVILTSTGSTSIAVGAPASELEAALAKLRTVGQGGRDDLELTAEPEVPFERVSALIRSAGAAGYTSIAFIPPHSLSNRLPD